MAEKILITDTSKQFKFFKQLVHDKTIREEEKKALIFGKKMIEESADIEAYLTTKDHSDDPFFHNKTLYILSDKGFKQLSELVNPEPYGAIIKIPHFSFNAITQGVFILDRLQDPGNIGTLFRTALGFGLDGILLLKNTCDPFSSKVIRSSKGAVFKIPHMCLSKTELDLFVKHHNLSVYIADLNGNNLNTIAPKTPFGILLGNEAQGVDPCLKTVGETIHIPQKNLESLNVAIAGAIIAYTFTAHKS